MFVLQLVYRSMAFTISRILHWASLYHTTLSIAIQDASGPLYDLVQAYPIAAQMVAHVAVIGMIMIIAAVIKGIAKVARYLLALAFKIVWWATWLLSGIYTVKILLRVLIL